MKVSLGREAGKVLSRQSGEKTVKARATAALCPECHKTVLAQDGGCAFCPNCGYSKCGG